jgi:hypothetical protein
MDSRHAKQKYQTTQLLAKGITAKINKLLFITPFSCIRYDRRRKLIQE